MHLSRGSPDRIYVLTGFNLENEVRRRELTMKCTLMCKYKRAVAFIDYLRISLRAFV